MIKNLRKKFILVSMCSMLAVLLGIVGGVLTAGYQRMTERTDRVLEMLAENNGEFPVADMERRLPEKPDRKEKTPHLSPEVPYETRYFSVTFDEAGTVLETQTGNVAAVQEEDAETYGEAVWKKGKTKGFYGSYRYLIRKEAEPMGIFVDCSRELDSFYVLLRASILLSLLGSSMVFLLVLFFSRRVFRPVAESYEKQKQFITDAGHELKTPLTIIDANTEVLEMTGGENEWTASIRKQVKRLTKLTQQMVALTRMEEGNGQKEMCMLCISQVIEEAAEPFCQVAENEGKKLLLSIEPGIQGKANEMLLYQLVSLLLDNALKYSLPESSISLTFRKKGKRAELVVSNETDMVSKGDLDILFERFYRTDASRNSETGGSGIGLSVAKAIVQMHKGRIHAASIDGKQITFTAVWER